MSADLLRRAETALRAEARRQQPGGKYDLLFAAVADWLYDEALDCDETFRRPNRQAVEVARAVLGEGAS